MNRLVISLAALTFAVSIPTIAFADAGRRIPDASELARPLPRKADKGERTRGEKEGERFPMKAETFRRVIDMRLQHAREKLERIIDRRDVPEAQEAEMKKDFERSADAVKAAVAKAEADGTVTKDEAKAIRQLVKNAKEHMQKKHGKGVGHDDKGKSKGKGGEGQSRTRARKS